MTLNSYDLNLHSFSQSQILLTVPGQKAPQEYLGGHSVSYLDCPTNNLQGIQGTRNLKVCATTHTSF